MLCIPTYQSPKGSGLPVITATTGAGRRALLSVIACGGLLLPPSAPGRALGQQAPPPSSAPAERGRPDPQSPCGGASEPKRLSAQEVSRKLLPSTCWVSHYVRVGCSGRLRDQACRRHRLGG